MRRISYAVTVIVNTCIIVPVVTFFAVIPIIDVVWSFNPDVVAVVYEYITVEGVVFSMIISATE